jgi:hypothetical protein
LGGSLDDLLGMLLDSLELLQHPLNAYYARYHTAFDHVTMRLDTTLQTRREAEVARGRRNIESLNKAARASAEQRREESRAKDWLEEVLSRKHGSKEQKYREIEDREGLQPGSVKKAVLRISKDQKK